MRVRYLRDRLPRRPGAPARFYVGILYTPAWMVIAHSSQLYSDAVRASIAIYMNNNRQPYSLRGMAEHVWASFTTAEPRCLLITGNRSYLWLGSEFGGLVQDYADIRGHDSPLGVIMLLP